LAVQTDTGVSRRVVVDTSVYSLDTVKKAAYRFLDRFAGDFSVNGNQIICSLTFQRGAADAAADAIVQDFQRELLDQDLREKVAAETAPIRNAILALAFSSVATPRGE